MAKLSKEEKGFLDRLKKVVKMINGSDQIDLEDPVKIPSDATLADAEKIIEAAISAGMSSDAENFPDEILDTTNDIADEINAYRKGGESDPKDKVETKDPGPSDPPPESKDQEGNDDPFGKSDQEPEGKKENPLSDPPKKTRKPRKATPKVDKNEKDRLISVLFGLVPQAQIDELKPDDMRGILKALK